MNARAIMGYVVLWIRVEFAAHTLLSGLNYFLHVLPEPPIGASAAGPFVAEMAKIGMYDLIKVVEVTAGFLLICNVLTPVALILEFPITVSIFWLSVHVVGVGRPVFTGWRELFLNGFLIAAYAGYYLPMVRLQARQRPLWDPDEWRQLRMGGA